MSKKTAIIVFVAGLLICLYPLMAKVYYNYDMSHQSKVVDRQFQVNATHQKVKYAQFEAYNRDMLSSQNIETPKVKVQTNNQYDEQLGTDDTIATIKIPKLNLHYPVYDQATPENLNRGVSRVIGTSFPVGGRSTNSVLAAHSYSPYHEWFTHIDKLDNGDKIIINNFKETLYYKVYDKKVVRPDQVEALSIIKGKDIITLLTCTPSGADRILIYAERTTKDGNKIKHPKTKPLSQEQSLMERLKVLSESWFVIVVILLLSLAFIKKIMHH
ncbi:class C sortase [Macrococcoides caseolyticum]|uniref:class C sortase n=1 Tax=Macrococcoides caseolyticum TaxID=69966 RepID=UPI0030EB5263